MNDQINQKPKHAERPDKPLFFAMMGAFFLFFASAPAYWVFYNFGEYWQTSAFVEDLKTKSEQFLTSDEKKEKESRIFFLSSRAARYKLEMVLSGVGSLVLFGISVLLFGKSLIARKQKNYYHEINWRDLPTPTLRVEVQYKKLYDVLAGFIISFFGGMILVILCQNFTNQFYDQSDKILRSLLLSVPLFLLSVLFLFLILRGKRKSVRFFDDSGVTRNDGKHFSWTEFCGVVTQIAFNRRTQRKYIWRIELAFSGGEEVWIIPNRIKNTEDVFSYLNALPKAVLRAKSVVKSFGAILCGQKENISISFSKEKT